MDTAAKLAVVGVAAGALYFLVIRRDPRTGQTALDQLTAPTFFPGSVPGQLPLAAPGNTSGYGPAQPISRGTAVIGAIGAGSAAVGSILAGGGASAAAGATAATAATGGGAAAGAAGGIGLAGVATIAGIAGGAAILTWAVWKKGLFRGGEEALLVNPDRDQFLEQFGPRWQGAGKGGPTFEESGLGRMAQLLFQMVGGPEKDRLYNALTQADRINEFVPATQEIQRVMAAHGVHIQAP